VPRAPPRLSWNCTKQLLLPLPLPLPLLLLPLLLLPLLLLLLPHLCHELLHVLELHELVATMTGNVNLAAAAAEAAAAAAAVGWEARISAGAAPQKLVTQTQLKGAQQLMQALLATDALPNKLHVVCSTAIPETKVSHQHLSESMH
jgi:hypothetical protein